MKTFASAVALQARRRRRDSALASAGITLAAVAMVGLGVVTVVEGIDVPGIPTVAPPPTVAPTAPPARENGGADAPGRRVDRDASDGRPATPTGGSNSAGISDVAPFVAVAAVDTTAAGGFVGASDPGRAADGPARAPEGDGGAGAGAPPSDPPPAAPPAAPVPTGGPTRPPSQPPSQPQPPREGPVSTLVDPVVKTVARTADGVTGGAVAPVTDAVTELSDGLTDTVDGLLGLPVAR